MFELRTPNSPVSSADLKKCEDALQLVLKNKNLGFVQLPERENLWQACEKLAYEWRKKVHHYVVIGIGGSSLGPQVISEVFGALQFTYIDSVDPIHFYRQLENLRSWDETGWIVTSKSGTTMETLCALEMVLQYGRNRYGTERLRHCAVITEDADNPLANWARENRTDLLEIPKDVGGRYSVLSPVGMFPAALAGLRLEEIRKGAQEALQNRALVSELMAQTLKSFEREEWITVFWIYNSRGLSLGRWIQQLWAESLGKKVDRQGKRAPRVSTPMAAVGPADQHSVLQQMMEGAPDKFHWFFRFADAESDTKLLEEPSLNSMSWLKGHSMGALLRAEGEATQKALVEEGRHTLALHVKSLDEEGLGYFFMLMELVVAGVAEVLNINAFDQPGVELGKRLARQQFMSRG